MSATWKHIFLRLTFPVSVFLFSPPAKAHRVSAVSALAEFSSEGTYQIDLSFSLASELDDGISPEAAAETYVKENLTFQFDEKEIVPDLRIMPVLGGEEMTVDDEGAPTSQIVAFLAGDIPENAGTFQINLSADAPAHVILVTSFDGKQSRRMKIVFPGEIGKPIKLKWPKSKEQSEQPTEVNVPTPNAGTSPSDRPAWPWLGLAAGLLCLNRDRCNAAPLMGLIALVAGLIVNYAGPDYDWGRSAWLIPCGIVLSGLWTLLGSLRWITSIVFALAAGLLLGNQEFASESFLVFAALTLVGWGFSRQSWYRKWLVWPLTVGAVVAGVVPVI